MYILGLNIGHNATACLLKDGEIVGAVSEERFSRIKNHSGIPFKAIEYLLKNNKISLSQIDLVVFDDHYPIFKNPNFGKGFLEAYTNKPLKNVILSRIGYKHPLLYDSYKSFFEKSSYKKLLKSRNKLRNEFSRILKFPAEKIIVTDHHLMHAYSTCFNIARNEKTLIFSLDGEGSGTCATVSIFDGRNLNFIARSSKIASLGYLYAITTIYLGMKPLEHEFKVMGMAPYAKQHGIDKIYPKFKKLIWVDNDLVFHSRFNMPFADDFFKSELKFARFDNISGAVQKLVEELVLEWVSKAIKKTGIHNIALSGGVFMNVKANQLILELPEVKRLFIMPSCGDEANAIGACCYGYKLYCEKNNIKFEPKPIRDLYLGPEYDNNYIKELIERQNLNGKYKIRRLKNINQEVSRLLANGEIVARCSGKSEWGARALGNRSIMANPVHPDTIRILNETIKDRDFWMPFTPSIIEDDINKYIINPKKIKAPYMVVTFDSTAIAKKHLPAAMHPYDFTIRPQEVHKSWNKDYYEIIKNFKRMTGIGAILNTSFNLHGEPNVLTPEDALHTVENSSLKYLVMGDYLFEKR